MVRASIQSVLVLSVLTNAGCAFSQSAPASPDHPWRSSQEQQIARDAQAIRNPTVSIDATKTYPLGELIDYAESPHPVTRVAWENARAQAAAWGVARAELYPTLAAIALSGVNRAEVPFGSVFYRPTLSTFEATLDLEYTVFDFGARAGRIAAAS